MKWLFGIATLLVIGLVYGLGLLVYAMYVLLGMVVVSRYLARKWMSDLSAERHCPWTAVYPGESITVTTTVRNRGSLPVPWLLIEDSLPAEAAGEGSRALRVRGHAVQLAQLKPRGERTLEYEIEFLRRGYFQIGPMLLESGDLFGLYRRYRVVTEPNFVLVYPKVVPVEDYDFASQRPVGEVRITHRLFEDPTRIAGVRLYQRGDPLNRIHWRATARTGVWHSKTYEPSCVAGATILLDFHRDSYRGQGDVYRAELAVTAAASLANAVQQLGQQVGFVSNGRDAADRIREEGWRQEFRTRAAARGEVGMLARSERLRPVVVETRRGDGQLMPILEALARLEWTDGMTVAELVAESANRMPRDASVIAVLSEVTEETAIALGGLRRGGYAVSAVLVHFDQDRPYHDWAQAPDWAGRLLAEGIEFKEISDEAGISNLCTSVAAR